MEEVVVCDSVRRKADRRRGQKRGWTKTKQSVHGDAKTKESVDEDKAKRSRTERRGSAPTGRHKFGRPIKRSGRVVASHRHDGDP